MGRDRLFRVLAEHRLLVKPKRAYHKTTHSFHRFYRHPNLLKPGPQQVLPCAPEQVWVADITYLPSQSGPLYLSLVTDAYSRKIVGHHVHDSLHAESVARAYSQALRYRTTRNPLVHHSDRGIQYCSELYQRLHMQHGATCSMTDGYDCYQNALAERVNGILKNELLGHPPSDLVQARRMVREAVDIYNREQPHLALKYETPGAGASGVLRSGAWPEKRKPISGLDRKSGLSPDSPSEHESDHRWWSDQCFLIPAYAVPSLRLFRRPRPST